MDTTIQMTGRLEPRDSWSAIDRCSIGKALDVLRNRSSFLIMREAFYGTARFEDFAERVGLSDPVTSARLRDLVEAGLLEREDYREPGQRTRKLYRLTEKGADLFPTLVALMQWGDRWENNGGGVELRHQGCGAKVGVEVRCANGHEVTSGELELAARRRVRSKPE
jgi:DNA-binding HxlR family transcriptional regulator